MQTIEERLERAARDVEHLGAMVGRLILLRKPQPVDDLYFHGLTAMGFMNDPPHKWMSSPSHTEIVKKMNPQQRESLGRFLKLIHGMMGGTDAGPVP